MMFRLSKRLIFASLFISQLTYALPFSITTKAGTVLPTQIILGQSINAYYSITNNTGSQRLSNYMLYLPPNVTQVVSDSGIPNLCGSRFNLQPKNTSGDTCTLELTITGGVNAQDPNPKHHLFACFPGGITCAGTPTPLNVNVISGNSEFVAGGFYTDINGNGFILFANSTNNGASWMTQSLPMLNGYLSAAVSGVSCSGTMCVGAANYQDTLSNLSAGIAVSTDKGATWRQQVLPHPNGYSETELSGVDCNGSNCLAVGIYLNDTTSNEQAGIALTNNNGTTWTQQVLPLAPGLQGSELLGVDCLGTTCVGVGIYQSDSFVVGPQIAISTNNGLTWSQQSLSLPPNIEAAVLKSVSCTGNTCMAVGEYIDSNNHDSLGIAISRNLGASWTQQVLTPPGSFTQGSFNGISCTSSYCIAVGSYSYGVNYTGYPAIALTTNNGVSWTQQTLPIPAGYVYGFLNSVTCAGSVCVAAGRYEAIGSLNNTPFVAVSTNSGTSWAQQVFPVPSNFTEGQFNGVG